MLQNGQDDDTSCKTTFSGDDAFDLLKAVTSCLLDKEEDTKDN
jgi:hypothetical protein